MALLALPVVLFLAYANGANDNFKGVATLFGSNVSGYRSALLWATVTTFAGSIAAINVAQSLLATFSGKGIVPDSVVTMPAFALVVVFASASTVTLATRLGLPVSTTHALVGSLIGAGIPAAHGAVNYAALGATMLLPLIAGPLVAVAGTLALYPVSRRVGRRLGVGRETCLCIGDRVVRALPAGVTHATAVDLTPAEIGLELAIGSRASCVERYSGRVVGVQAAQAIDLCHYLSAGAVGFARGLNDTPKIAAVLLLAGGLAPHTSFAAVAVAMAVGGLLSAQRVAETISHKVADINAGQGLVANLVTSTLVIAASRVGLPVSTTHVSLGSLFGIGAANGHAHWRTVVSIVAAWIFTLPLAALLAGVAYLLIQFVRM